MTTPNKDNLETLYRSMVIIWIAQIMSVVMFFVVTQLVEVPADRPENNVLSFTFAAVGTFCAVISFVVRARLLRQSLEQQDPALIVQHDALRRPSRHASSSQRAGFGTAGSADTAERRSGILRW